MSYRCPLYTLVQLKKKRKQNDSFITIFCWHVENCKNSFWTSHDTTFIVSKNGRLAISFYVHEMFYSDMKNTNQNLNLHLCSCLSFASFLFDKYDNLIYFLTVSQLYIYVERYLPSFKKVNKIYISFFKTVAHSGSGGCSLTIINYIGKCRQRLFWSPFVWNFICIKQSPLVTV